jgi:NAD(P)H-dependent FMN reductase
MYSAYKNKVAAIVSASPGPLGGLRAQFHLRDILLNLGCDLVGNSATIGGAYQAFADDGTLTNEKQRAHLLAVVDDLCHRSAMKANSSAMRELHIAHAAGAGSYGELTFATERRSAFVGAECDDF